jgi:hypothetical protein
MSTGDPFHLLGTALFHGVARVPVRPRAQSQMATMAQLRVADLSLNLKGPTNRAGHSKADPAWTHLGSWLKAVHLRAKSPAADEARRGAPPP